MENTEQSIAEVGKLQGMYNKYIDRVGEMSILEKLEIQVAFCTLAYSALNWGQAPVIIGNGKLRRQDTLFRECVHALASQSLLEY